MLSKATFHALSHQYDPGITAIAVQMHNFSFPTLEMQEIPLILKIPASLTDAITNCLSPSIIYQLCQEVNLPLPKNNERAQVLTLGTDAKSRPA